MTHVESVVVVFPFGTGAAVEPTVYGMQPVRMAESDSTAVMRNPNLCSDIVRILSDRC
jgi:hypothetical protein